MRETYPAKWNQATKSAVFAPVSRRVRLAGGNYHPHTKQNKPPTETPVWADVGEYKKRGRTKLAGVKKVQDKGQSLAGKHRPAGRAEERLFADHSPDRVFFRTSSCHWSESGVTIFVTEMPEKPMVERFSLSQICHCTKFSQSEV